MPSDLIYSDDHSSFVNASDNVAALENLIWPDIFRGIDDAENSYREALFSVMMGPAREAHNHTLATSSAKRKPRNSECHPLFKSCTQDGHSQKFHYVRKLTLTRAWFFENGYLTPFLDRPIESYTRFPKFFPAGETILSLSNDQLSSLLRYIILDSETRHSLAEGFWETSIEADFQKVREKAGDLRVKQFSPERALNELFESGLGPEWNQRSYPPYRRALFHFLFHFASIGKILLPAPKVARQKRHFSYLYASCLRPLLLKNICRSRLDEVIHVKEFLSKSSPSRISSNGDLACLFCCSNYADVVGYAPETVYLVRQSLTGEKHNLLPYFLGLADYYQVSAEEMRFWEARFSDRRSEELKEEPLALFRADATLVRKLLPRSVKNFEKKTSTRYPDAFPQAIQDWADELEHLLRLTPRNERNSMYRSIRLWLMYLYTLDEIPESFTGVERALHIVDFTHPDARTYWRFLEKNELQTRGPLRDLYQLRELWAQDESDPPDNPIHPKEDWKNPEKSFGTHRKAIPPLVVDTLIEENARDGSDGLPYGFYRDTQARRDPTSRIRFEGKAPTEVIPAVPGCLDCILTFGLRSSSSRWADSGQGDEYAPDVDSLLLTPNLHPSATPGRRSGAIQISEAPNGNPIRSLLVLKDKSGQAFEVPYLPLPLAKRLQFVAERQAKFNPISQPIRAVEDEATARETDDQPFVFPLFLHPNRQGRPVTGSMLHTAWRELLHHCEPIVHAKRGAQLGDDIEPWSFFDADGDPIWDIHSIRVSVVTALLDLGVPPTIVQRLVGHANPIMTLHYYSIGPERVQSSIEAAMDHRRLETARAISVAESEEELVEALVSLLGGLANCVAGEEGPALARQRIRRSGKLWASPDAISVFSHGICPGGTCSTGGEKRGNYYFAVHRDKACSRCRFRITGPAFLNGLVMNANLLMLEIGDSVRKEQELNSQILQAHRSGDQAAILESRLSQERSYRDELWADWAAEYRTIEQCVELQDQRSDDSCLPVLPDNFEVKHQIREGDQLSLLQDILEKQRVIRGSTMDVPEGLRARRDEMLWEIARQDGDVSSFLFSLPLPQRDLALEAYASMVAHLPTGERSKVGIRDIEKALRSEPATETSNKQNRIGD